MKKKHLLIPALALTLGVGALTLNSTQVQATDADGMTSFRQNLAGKLGISEDQVQTAMEEMRSERQAERQAEFEASLDEAVANGDLTEDQKQAIIDKHAEMQAEREANRPEMGEKQDLSEEEREAMRAERQAEGETRKAEMEAWATENGIDLEFLQSLRGGSGEGRGNKGAGGGMRGMAR